MAARKAHITILFGGKFPTHSKVSPQHDKVRYLGKPLDRNLPFLHILCCEFDFQYVVEAVSRTEDDNFLCSGAFRYR